MCCARPRERVVWSPVWNKDYECWSAKFIKENMWRCDHRLSFQDLMQEAWLIFNHIAQSYPRVIEEKLFMALFKRASINKMHDRSCHKNRRKDSEVRTSKDVSEFFVGRIGEVTNAGYLAAILAEAPEELKLAIKLFAEGHDLNDQQAEQLRELLAA